VLCLIIATAGLALAARTYYFYPPGVVPDVAAPPYNELTTGVCLSSWCDTQIDSNAAAVSFGADEFGHAESNLATRGPAHVLFLLTGVFDDIHVQLESAELHLYAWAADRPGTAATIAVARVRNEWDDDTASWLNPTWILDTAYQNASNDGLRTANFLLNQRSVIDVTAAMIEEFHDSTPRGMALIDSAGASPYFMLRGNGVASQAPFLKVVVPEPMAWLQLLGILLCSRMRFRTTH
jgi:hypothetical protein